jgi:hypothetical protein
MPGQVLDEPAASPRIEDALDFARLDEIERLSDLASSYCKSLALAAGWGDELILAVHCRQIAPVIREVFTLVGELARGTEGSSS